MRRILPFAVLALAAALPATAQTLKPGLWEVTNRMNNPQMDQALAQVQQQMAAMPPEQRRQMEEMMAKQGARMVPSAGGGMALQVCMTREMAERNEVPMQEGCAITSQQRTGNSAKMAFTCSKPPSSGESQVTFAGPEAYTSRMKLTTSVSGKPETMTMEGAGKWLKADCGAIQPVMPPKK